MDEILYQALTSYYHALELKGYMSQSHSTKLLILIFFRDFVFHDYNALLSKEDYRLIERALDCIYGTSCLIPYPDYLKMGKLHIGEMTELAERIKTMENEKVLKLFSEDESDSDVYIDDSDE